MFRLAHVTDPHFRSLEGAKLGDFLGKRAVGGINLLVNRRRKHDMRLLESMSGFLASLPLSHIAVTGDLSNVSLEGEWRRALAWLGGLGRAPDDVTVIPGNHDVYVPHVAHSRVFERLFAAHQTAELRLDEAAYPFVRLRDDVALVAVNTCVPTGDLGAWGQIGDAQRQRLEALLTADEVRRRVRVVLLHHPPVVHRPPEHRNLRDRVQLGAVLGRVGADLVLHGHDHRDEHTQLEGPDGRPIPVVGAGSASYAGGPSSRARFNVYEIAGPGAPIEMVVHGHDATNDIFVPRGQRRL